MMTQQEHMPLRERQEHQEHVAPRKLSRRGLIAGLAIAGVAVVGGISWKIVSTSADAAYVYHAPPGVFDAIWSADGTRITSTSTNVVHTWDALTGEHDSARNGPLKNKGTIGWSPDGNYFAVEGEGGAVDIWQVATWQRSATFKGMASAVSALAWSPDSTRLAIGSVNKLVQVVQVEQGTTITQLMTIQSFGDNVSGIAWHPDGTRIAISSWDTTVQIWDMTSKTSLYTYHGHDIYPVNTVAWSPDGRYLASTSGVREDNNPPGRFDVQVWRATDGVRVYRYEGHTSFVHHVAWSPDGKRLASAGEDSTVQVWDAFDGGNAAVHHGHTHSVNSLTWSPQQLYLASTGEDTVRIWRS